MNITKKARINCTQFELMHLNLERFLKPGDEVVIMDPDTSDKSFFLVQKPPMRAYLSIYKSWLDMLDNDNE